MKISLPQSGSSLRDRRLTLRLRVALSMTVLAMLLNIAVMLFVLITIPEAAKFMSLGRSLFGMSFMVLITGVSAYWVAGMALRPVREISQAAHSIYADTLDTRLYVSGPKDELKELAESFNAMLYRLQQAFEQQGRFVANAAHELRTPLTTLRTNLEVVCADPHASLDDYRGMASTLERQMTRLERLVADLLLLTVERRSLTSEQVTLMPLLEDVLHDLQPLAEVQQVELAIEGENSLVVQGDAMLLGRVFSNLIENAIRYNQPGGRVTLRLERDGGLAIVKVSDTGIGIDGSELDHIFERFYRVDQSRARHKGGAGLGLSLAAHIVQQHGGGIQVQSKPQHGSTFTVQLP